MKKRKWGRYSGIISFVGNQTTGFLVILLEWLQSRSCSLLSFASLQPSTHIGLQHAGLSQSHAGRVKNRSRRRGSPSRVLKALLQIFFLWIVCSIQKETSVIRDSLVILSVCKSRLYSEGTFTLDASNDPLLIFFIFCLKQNDASDCLMLSPALHTLCIEIELKGIRTHIRISPTLNTEY